MSDLKCQIKFCFLHFISYQLSTLYCRLYRFITFSKGIKCRLSSHVLLLESELPRINMSCENMKLIDSWYIFQLNYKFMAIYNSYAFGLSNFVENKLYYNYGRILSTISICLWKSH